MIRGEPWLGWVVLLPLAGGLGALLAGERARVVALPGALASFAAALALCAAVAREGVLHLAVGDWAAPLGIALRADGLAALWIAVSGAVGCAATAFAASTGARAPFHALWLFGWAGLNALALSADLFNLYVTIELVTLAAVGLIALADGRAALGAALRYLLVALAGSLAYLVGVVLLYARHSTLDLRTLAAQVGSGPLESAAFAAIVLGLALKTALFPLHGWLPPAYAAAPATASVVLAGLMGKASFYVLLRLWFEALPAELRARPAHLLGLLGALAVLWGGLLALRQPRLRLVLAYSSLGQIGYFFLVFPLGTREARAACALLLVSHAAAKGAMFMSVHAIERAAGSDELERVRGLAYRLPLTFFTLGVCGLTLMGLPPSGGFVAKWMYLRASLSGAQWWWAAVLIGGGLLAAAYVFRVLRLAFLPAVEEAPPAKEGAAALLPLALALLSLTLGVLARWPLALLEGADP